MSPLDLIEISTWTDHQERFSFLLLRKMRVNDGTKQFLANQIDFQWDHFVNSYLTLDKVSTSKNDEKNDEKNDQILRLRWISSRDRSSIELLLQYSINYILFISHMRKPI